MECFSDDERIAAWAICENSDDTIEKVYKDLLNLKIDDYIDTLERFYENKKCKEMKEWIKDILYKIETSRNPLLVITDFEHFEI